MSFEEPCMRQSMNCLLTGKIDTFIPEQQPISAIDVEKYAAI
jgi:hypothetical protein